MLVLNIIVANNPSGNIIITAILIIVSNDTTPINTTLTLTGYILESIAGPNTIYIYINGQVSGVLSGSYKVRVRLLFQSAGFVATAVNIFTGSVNIIIIYNN